jgi:hypothetical protein
VRRNALKHGLAAFVLADASAAIEVERIALILCGAEADDLEREQALIVAETQVALKRVRAMRTRILQEPASASSVEQLLRLERYEDRALSRKKRAARLILP